MTSDTGMSKQVQAPLRWTDHFNIVGELMGTLDLVTRSGQGHVMRRVLSILRHEIMRPGLPLTDAQLVPVMGALSELEHEAARRAPAPILFSRHTEAVVDVLRQAWNAESPPDDRPRAAGVRRPPT